MIGSDEAWWTRRILKMDLKLATFGGRTDVMKVMFAYWTGLLPYLHIDREALMLPYMTRDFIKMKEIEREQAKSFFSRIFLTLYIYIG